MATDLVLVRHASSVVPTVDGPDEMTGPLREEGLAQARHLVRELVALRPTAVVSSPYPRAVQTVQPTAEAAGLAVETRWELREWESGLAVTPDYEVHYARSWSEPDFARPGGESLQQLTDRAVAAVARLADEHPGGVVLIGSHGTFVSRVLAGLALAVDWPFSRDMPMPAVYRVRWDGGTATTAHGPGLPVR